MELPRLVKLLVQIADASLSLGYEGSVDLQNLPRFAIGESRSNSYTPKTRAYNPGVQVDERRRTLIERAQRHFGVNYRYARQRLRRAVQHTPFESLDIHL